MIFSINGQLFDSDYLQHHGILGMKWGVRRFQNKDGTLTAAGKRRYRETDIDKVYSTYVQAHDKKASKSKQNVYPDDPINLRYNPMKVMDINIPKGTVFKRVSTNEIDNTDSPLYMSFDKDYDGRNYYNFNWSDSLIKDIKKNENIKIYENTFVTDVDIRAPGLEERRKIVNALFESDKKVKEEFGKEYVMKLLNEGGTKYKNVDDYINSLPDKWKDFGREKVKRQLESIDKNIAEINSGYYDDNQSRLTAIIPTSKKFMNLYVNELKKRGYNAVFDDNSGTAAPFIIFDKKSISQTESKLLKSEEETRSEFRARVNDFADKLIMEERKNPSRRKMSRKELIEDNRRFIKEFIEEFGYEPIKLKK